MQFIFLISALVATTLAFPNNVFEFEQERPEKNGGTHWALLVAGSNGYFNYRHQADVCHAYQVLKNHGFDEDNIITMMFDDIAENRDNPVKGNIINHPDGPNVYEGVKIDYKGEDVNPDTFIAALKGDANTAGGKVINSTQDDYIFVNFVDHGAPGILGFGDDFLKASVLNKAIKYMYDEKRYAKMVFYVEACESGSIFLDLLPKNINVFATTASNAHESSYACYYDKTRKTYLGDVYSIKWMQDSDKEDLNTETLKKQFKITKSETNTSHVQEFGDLKMGDMTVAEFQGEQMGSQSNPAHDPCADAVRSEEVPMATLLRRHEMEDTEEGKAEIQAQIDELIEERRVVDKTMKILVGMATEGNGDHELSTKVMETKSHIRRWECYEEAVDHLIETCPDHLNLPKNDYALRKLFMVVNLCENNIPIETIKSAAEKTCDMEM